MQPIDVDTELVPYPAMPPNVALDYGELPSAADFELRVIAAYQRHLVKPSWRAIGSYHVVAAAGAPFETGPNTPLPVNPSQLADILTNLVTMSYIGTEWGSACRASAVALARRLGIIWPRYP